VLDIGANTGQFARYTRERLEFKKKIISFEPMSRAFASLQANAENDPEWTVQNCAIGDEVGKKEINIAGNSFSSSLLDMLPAHLDAAPHSKYEDKEWVEVKTLDSFLGSLFNIDEKVFLKIDTQGFEKQVLHGAKESLPHISTIQLEMSLVPLYRGEMVFAEMYPLMLQFGFGLIDVDGGFSDPKTGRLLQIDGIFQRPSP
jgi:FkbM family methyltransferase